MPVGERYLHAEGAKTDRDSVTIHKRFEGADDGHGRGRITLNVVHRQGESEAEDKGDDVGATGRPERPA